MSARDRPGLGLDALVTSEVKGLIADPEGRLGRPDRFAAERAQNAALFVAGIIQVRKFVRHVRGAGYLSSAWDILQDIQTIISQLTIVNV